MRKLRLIATVLFLLISFGTAITLIHVPAPAYAATCPDGVTEVPTDGATQCPAFTDAPCEGGSFLGFPKWYKYLKSQGYRDEVTGKQTCIPQVDGLSDIWKIVAAMIELLTRLATLIAIGFIVYGGITYTLSQGNPDKTKQALKTIINALVGLVITIIAVALVSYIAGRF